MLRSLRGLESYTVSATDGDIGTVSNLLVDGERWTVRYLVADTGRFFSGRRVLVSPSSFRRADWSTKSLDVQLTMHKVKHAPPIDADRSVSLAHDQELSAYYGHPSPSGDGSLTSVNEVRGYHVLGNDGDIGRIEDFIVDDESWAVRYFVIDTSTWRLGDGILLAPQRASRVSPSERKFFVEESRSALFNGPAWNHLDAVSRS